MKDLVSPRSIGVVGSISALLLLWAIFVSPGGIGVGLIAVGALSVLLVASTAVQLLGRLRSPAASLAQTIQNVDKEAAAAPSADWRAKAIL
ncbi:MAG: hypothetical protein DMF78_19410 [Acidobacteria bacterium]|nr:MAG: hypothetical protein DMF78_19410 [Acidobacteriota bacterium]